MKWQLDVEPAPGILVLPPAAASLDEAHEAIAQWEYYSGKTLDPSQRLAVEVMMAETADQRWAARTTGREMSRQNGKGDELEVPEFWDLTQRDAAILHTAHQLKTVGSAHERMVALLQGHKDLRRLIGQVLNGIGQQKIVMTSGAVIQYATRTNGGGRGLDDISRLVVDEAQHAQPEQLASSTPILMANPNPQTNFAGTGGIEGVSAWWWSLRLRAIGEDPGDFGYMGHTVERITIVNGEVQQSEVDPSDRSKWPDANPALHVGRAEMEFFEEQFRTLGPRLFGREHLAIWDPPPAAGGAGPISTERWAKLVDGSSLATDETLSLGLSAPLGRDTACFSASGRRADGAPHASIRYWVKPGDIAGLVDVAKQLADGHGVQINIPAKDPALAWFDDLEAAGVTVNVPKDVDLIRAQQSIEQDVADGTLRHRGQVDMNDAVSGLAARTSGDSSPWSRRSSTSNTAPLMALAAARAGGRGEKPAEFFIY